MFKSPVGYTLAAVLALSAGAAGAQGVAQSSVTHSDVSEFTGGPDTLPTMVRRIQDVTGGRVVEIRFTTADGMPGYRAVVAKNGRLTFLRIAAQGGDSVELAEASLPDWMLHWRSRSDLSAAEHAQVPLVQAIRTAEATAGGAPAVAAGIATSASNPTSSVKAYNVLVDRDGSVRRLAVDDQTGQVISDPQALAGWP